MEVIEEEDKLDAIEESDGKFKALETRATDTKREMDILDALQDLRSRNARHERLAGTDGAKEALDARIEVLDEDELLRKKEEEEDDAIVRQYFSKIPDPSIPSTSGAGPSSISKPPSPGAVDDLEAPKSPSTDATSLPSTTPSQHTITVKRKADFLEPDLTSIIAEAAKAAMPKAAAPAPSKKKKTAMASALGIKVKPKTKT